VSESTTQKLRRAWAGLRTGERVLFFTAGLLLIFGFFFWLAAITGTTDILRVREVYEETPKTDRGFQIFKRSGCRNCHVVMKIGEWGLAPELDGEGTRRSYAWIRAYLEDPNRQMGGKTLHNGLYGGDFSQFDAEQKELIATFLFAQKSFPGAATYPEPPK